MAIERVSGFEADEEDLILYNRQAIIDLAIEYEFEDDTIYTFPGYASSFLNVYDSMERNTLEKSWTTQITRNSNVQVINASVSDCTFTSKGQRYYELGYVRSAYNIVLRYGKLFVK
jgi:hypothetical protein